MGERRDTRGAGQIGRQICGPLAGGADLLDVAATWIAVQAGERQVRISVDGGQEIAELSHGPQDRLSCKDVDGRRGWNPASRRRELRRRSDQQRRAGCVPLLVKQQHDEKRRGGADRQAYGAGGVLGRQRRRCAYLRHGVTHFADRQVDRGPELEFESFANGVAGLESQPALKDGSWIHSVARGSRLRTARRHLGVLVNGGGQAQVLRDQALQVLLWRRAALRPDASQGRGQLLLPAGEIRRIAGKAGFTQADEEAHHRRSEQNRGHDQGQPPATKADLLNLPRIHAPSLTMTYPLR
jgi:hypothetical protein